LEWQKTDRKEKSGKGRGRGKDRGRGLGLRRWVKGRWHGRERKERAEGEAGIKMWTGE
jgi:hypothetical protein